MLLKYFRRSSKTSEVLIYIYTSFPNILKMTEQLMQFHISDSLETLFLSLIPTHSKGYYILHFSQETLFCSNFLSIYEIRF